MAKDDHSLHFIGQVAQKAFITDGDRVLLVQYPEGDECAGLWDLPGGRLHNGEAALDGLKREVKEETQADIEVHEVLATGINVVNENFKLYWVLYRVSLINPEQSFVPEEGEIGTVAWKKKEEFFTTLPVLCEAYREALKKVLA